MRSLSRLAIGTIPSGPHQQGTIQPAFSGELTTAVLLTALSQAGDSPVLFRSSLDPAPRDVSQFALGRASRHLDSWAMSRSDAISALARGAGSRETALVTGRFDSC